MNFSCIYSFDVPRDVSIKSYLPSPRSQWQQTEGDSEYDYGYLEGRWTHGKHRKFCAVLSEEDFAHFHSALSFGHRLNETMGMIGAPGAEPFYASMPAWALSLDDEDSIGDVYLCPLATRAELAEFIGNMGYDAPQVLRDVEGQSYLWVDVEEEMNALFELVKTCLEEWLQNQCEFPEFEETNAQ